MDAGGRRRVGVLDSVAQRPKEPVKEYPNTFRWFFEMLSDEKLCFFQLRLIDTFHKSVK